MYIIISISATFVDIPISVSMQKRIPNEKLGRVYGVIIPLAQGLTPLGAIMAGLVINNVYPWILPLVCGVILMILTLFMTRVKDLKGI